MERRGTNIPIKITKDHTVPMYNEGSLHLLEYFFIALILLIFIIYINHIRCHRLFDLLLYAIFFMILIPPPLICPLYYPSLASLKILPSPSPYSCNCCHNQHMISSPEPPTYLIPQYFLLKEIVPNPHT